jgi:hypothetical protein
MANAYTTIEVKELRRILRTVNGEDRVCFGHLSSPQDEDGFFNDTATTEIYTDATKTGSN